MGYGTIVLCRSGASAARKMLERCDVAPATQTIFYVGDILRRLLEGGAVDLDYVHDALERSHRYIREGDFSAAVATIARSGLLHKVRSVSPLLADYWEEKAKEVESQGLPKVAEAIRRISARGDLSTQSP